MAYPNCSKLSKRITKAKMIIFWCCTLRKHLFLTTGLCFSVGPQFSGLHVYFQAYQRPLLVSWVRRHQATWEIDPYTWAAYSHSSLLKEERDFKLYKWHPFERDFSVCKTPGRKCYIKPKKCMSCRTEVSSFSVQLLSHFWLFVTPWTIACQDSLSINNSQICLNSCLSSRWCHLSYLLYTSRFSHSKVER